MKNHRIAVGGIMTECNHLGGQPTTLERFAVVGELRRGDEILTMSSGAMSGALEVLRDRDCEIVPLLLAETCPGGPLTRECYDTLKTELLERLRASMPVDGVTLSLHGSAAVEDEPDLEGDLLEAIREIVGDSVPIVGSLDTHGNVTARMVRFSDALCAFATYPHIDGPDTGARATKIMLQILDGEARPTMALAKVPVLVSGTLGHTEGEGPFADVMRLAKKMELKEGVLSTSVLLVHPYLDVPNMGGGGLVITDDDEELAIELASEIAHAYWERRFDLEPETHTPEAAIELGNAISGGPIILAEVADCTGGGATGDSVHTLRALLESGQSALVPVVDPEAVHLCINAGEGAEVTLNLGHKLDSKWGKPLQVTGIVRKISDGHFVYEGGFWSGQHGEMGLCAVLEIGAVQVLITTNATYEWADEQFAAMGLDARAAKFVVAKNPMNYSLAYKNIARAMFILDTPGPTPGTLRGAGHKNVARPFYPMDEHIENLEPTISMGANHHATHRTLDAPSTRR